MKTQNKGLQKLTQSELKINGLFKKEQIQIEDLDILTKREKKKFQKLLTEKYAESTGLKQDKFLAKVDPILEKNIRNQIWENNHTLISWAMSVLMQESCKMPTKTEIAEKTKLSRQTVCKHLKEYPSHPLYKEHMEGYKILTSKVLARVYDYAVNGDVQAAKLFFDVMGNLNKNASNQTYIENQNNYIQINNTTITQEQLQKLSPDKLSQIVGMIEEENQM